jgi:hypothetical protein
MPCMTASVTNRAGTVYMSSSSMPADQQQLLLLRVPAAVKVKRTASSKMIATAGYPKPILAEQNLFSVRCWLHRSPV